MNYVKKMMGIQDGVNEHTVAGWKTKNFAWRRAIWLEAAEGVESSPWKWWKKGEFDYANIYIELVDKWHFALSLAVLDPDFDTVFAEEDNIAIFKWTKISDNKEKLIESIENIARAALTEGSALLLLGMIAKSMAMFGMTREGLIKLYLGKATLNKFRQDNGYKDGTYVKMWGDVEDNVIMTSMILNMNLDEDFEMTLSEKLGDMYGIVSAV